MDALLTQNQINSFAAGIMHRRLLTKNPKLSTAGSSTIELEDKDRGCIVVQEQIVYGMKDLAMFQQAVTAKEVRYELIKLCQGEKIRFKVETMFFDGALYVMFFYNKKLK